MVRRPRKVTRAPLPAGPVRELREVMYRLYLEADCPRLDELARVIAADDDLAGSPGKDLIGKIVGGGGAASQQDTVSVAVALARSAGHRQIAVVAQQVRQLWLAVQTAAPPVSRAGLGRPVADCDPLALEVHPAIDLAGQERSGDRVSDRLPAYMARAHDEQLRKIAAEVIAGGSRLVTLVGGSSTGKTRACWELAQYLDHQDPSRWRLWHPYDPTRPAAAVAAIDQAGPHTIVWLNDAQHYLMLVDLTLGERIAASLRTLLYDPRRAPVLVLATLWPEYWSALSTPPLAGTPDPFAQARVLLNGTVIPVADVFTPDEMATLTGPEADPRLQQAATYAEGGRITQYLAGVPELIDRYRTAPPAARAIIQVAMDARRLGYPPALAHALLDRAAPGYLDDHDWDIVGEDWLEQALAYNAQPCKGARGPLTRIRTRPGEQSPQGAQPCYRLADYLEQAGRSERHDIYPPESLWIAFNTTITEPDLLRRLAQEAQLRGRYQHAIWLYTRAAEHGDNDALRSLAEMREQAGDVEGAQDLYRQAIDREVAHFARLIVESLGPPPEIRPAGAADPNSPALFKLHGFLRGAAGDVEGAQELYRQAMDRGDPEVPRLLAHLREEAGDLAEAEALLRQAAGRGDLVALLELAALRERAGDRAEVEVLHGQIADHDDRQLDFLGSPAFLAALRERAGDWAEAEVLYRQAVDGGYSDGVRKLADLRKRAGDAAGADRLLRFGLTGSGDVARTLLFDS